MKPRRALSLVLFVLTLGGLLVQAASQGPNYAGAASSCRVDGVQPMLTEPKIMLALPLQLLEIL
jgi:hypothetical protein